MKQCWDADPLKRPDAYTLYEKMNEINLYYLKKSDEPTQLELNKNFEINKTSSFKINSSSRSFTSKVHQFGFFSEPKNATEEEQEEFYSKSYDDFQIPDNIDDFNKSIGWENNNTLKMSSIFKVEKNYPKYLKEVQRMANIRGDYKIETMQQQIKNINLKEIMQRQE
ncbi:hypothetical protein RhiirC2_797731 [Rhizophagus irregularis]|uniref:Serine-threonine/tyrosine-protein kinase catalytic domain-containing protein n=1 Tax=Rhizophagus irregularis TaxID=588596 RepID=A0A2N1M7L5_9GLOM|nr:hypothetical protein RhiirC2_797731 [Rhizophagus irregularis]